MSNSFLGQITINVSFVIYIVQFLPQILHNKNNPATLSNISLWTQAGMICVILANVVQAIGFHLNWQYLVIALVYLLGLSIQQIQLSKSRKDIPVYFNALIVLFFIIAILTIFLGKKISYETAGWISFCIHFIYWLPQIYKNYRQKKFTGYSDLFIVFAWLGIICDCFSSIFLNWPAVVKMNVGLMATVISILIIQKIYYRFFYKTTAVLN